MRGFGTGMAIALALLAASAGADPDRADRALSGVAVGEGTFTDQKMQEVVVPYRANPPEQSLEPEEFEDGIRTIRESNTTTGRMLRSTEDSVTLRPKVEIDAQGPLFDDANYAHENAGKIFGDIFTSRNPVCEPVGLPASRMIDQFCESLPRRKTRTCDLVRKIRVDRTDTYRCDKRARRYIKVCDRRTSYSCQKTKPFNTCLRNNIRVANAASSWRDDTLIIDMPPLPPDYSTGGGHLRKADIRIKVSDHLRLSEAILTWVEANGAIQVIADGTILGTWGGARQAGFGRPGAHCPSHDSSAKLAAATILNTCTPHGGPPVRASFAALTNGDLTAESNYTQSGSTSPDWDTGGGPSPFTMIERYGQWEMAGGEEASEEVYRCYEKWPKPGESCHLFSNVTAMAPFGQNVLRFLTLREAESLNPETPKHWVATDLQLRVAYANKTSNGGAKVGIAFKGSCCDSFERLDEEVCK